MSKSSLQSFNYKVKQESAFANGVKEDMRYILSEIPTAISDSVGESAVYSLNKLEGVFTYAYENVISKSHNASNILESGYDKLSDLLTQADGFVSHAESLIKELGEP